MGATDGDRWLSLEDVASVLAGHEPGLVEVALALREVVLDAAPEVCESVKFAALCYFHADREWGAIGGNVCLIRPLGGQVRLEFIHGVRLADPKRLLQGRAKSKRYVVVPNVTAARQPELRALIRAAADVRISSTGSSGPASS